MLVGILGLAGSGKDETANMFVKYHNFIRIAFADPVKRIVQDVFDFDDQQLWGPSKFRNEPVYH
jgi:dephospho-CoA kinase